MTGHIDAYTKRLNAYTKRLNAFTGLASRGCRLDGERKRLGFDEILPEMSRAFADLAPDVVEELCRRWVEGPDGEWFPSEHALRRLAPSRHVEPRAQLGDGWRRDAEAALGQLAGCFLRRIQQLERGDHERFGRELAAWLPTNTAGPRGVERWVADWLGADWWALMGPTPEPVAAKPGSSWKAAR